MGTEELFYFCLLTFRSQGLNMQFRAFVCITASEEPMNGLFNATFHNKQKWKHKNVKKQIHPPHHHHHEY